MHCRLLHPFMPFVTEELWQRLPRGGDAGAGPCSIMVADYPAPGDALAADWRDQEVSVNPPCGLMSRSAVLLAASP